MRGSKKKAKRNENSKGPNKVRWLINTNSSARVPVEEDRVYSSVTIITVELSLYPDRIALSQAGILLLFLLLLLVSKLRTLSQGKLVEWVVCTIRAQKSGWAKLTEIDDEIIWNSVDNPVFLEESWRAFLFHDFGGPDNTFMLCTIVKGVDDCPDTL